jgi:thiosulfate/3-mercaptopyruvate sulfurtransferase
MLEFPTMSPMTGGDGVAKVSPTWRQRRRLTTDPHPFEEEPAMTTREATASDQIGRNHGTGVLVDPEWLAVHLDDPRVRVVEVDVSAASYDDWHLDGAVLWNIYQDLKDPNYRPVDRTVVESLIARSGIEPDSKVVFYGYAPAFGFWLLTHYGHRDVGILDCGREVWRAEGRPWTTGVVLPAHTNYRLAEEDGANRALAADVRAAIGRDSTTLVDVRSVAEFLGERFWPSGGMEPGARAGHVPGACHQPIDGLYDDHGSLRPSSELRTVFGSVDLDSDDELITYCTIGGRAATAWFVLTQLLGRRNVRVYDGSWAEWGRSAGAPVEAAGG